jgi:hypothetical protein
MTDAERRAFLLDGTRTAILGTTHQDGRPMAVPVGFTLDGDDVIILTSDESLKAKALQRDPRVSVVVDDPPGRGSTFGDDRHRPPLRRRGGHRGLCPVRRRPAQAPRSRAPDAHRGARSGRRKLTAGRLHAAEELVDAARVVGWFRCASITP